MGYDDNECLFCYTHMHGNEITDNEITICVTCLENHIGTNITGRVLSAFSGAIEFSSNNPCSICNETKKLLCSVCCCDVDYHFKEEEKDSSQ